MNPSKFISFVSMGFILVLMCNSSLFAQDNTIKKLTLTEAVDLSLKNNKTLRKDTARIAEATAAIREAKDKQLPDLKVSGAYLRFNQPNIDLKTNNSGSGGGAQTPLGIDQAIYGMANLSLPIYSGMRIHYGIESSKYLENAVKADADNNKEEVILNTIGAYVNLYKASHAVKLVQENLDQSRKRVADFASLEKNGLLARNDLLKVQLESYNVELALTDAQKDWNLANINMNIIIGLPESTQLDIDSSFINLPQNLQTVDQYLTQASANRHDVKALNFREKAAETGTRATKGEYYPSLALTGGYIAAEIPNFLTMTNVVNVGVGVNYSVSSLWKTKAKVQQAKARESQILADAAALDDNIRKEVNTAYQEYLVSVKRIEVFEKSIDESVENYHINKNKYANSLVTATELLDADIAQLRARLNYEFAKADALYTYHKLLQAAGILPSFK